MIICLLQMMNRDDYAETIACLLRVAWAAAAGQLQLNNNRNKSDDDSEHLNSLRSGICLSRSEISPMVCNYYIDFSHVTAFSSIDKYPPFLMCVLSLYNLQSLICY